MMEKSCMCHTSETVIAQIIDALHAPGNLGDRDAWQDFFLSDAFLDVYRDAEFLPQLVEELVRREGKEAVCNLDPVFLQELALVWQVTADLSLEGQWRKEQYQERQALLELLFAQKDPECLIWDEDARILDRSDAFYDFGRFVEMAKKGRPDTWDLEEWGSLFYCAEELYAADPLAGEEYFPSDFSVHREEKFTRNEIVEPDSWTCVRIQAYLVRHYYPSMDVCLSMWENFEVEGRTGGYPLCSYEPVFCEMEKLYPDLARTPEGELILWKKELLQRVNHTPEELEELFSRPVFLEYRDRWVFIRWLTHCLRCKQLSRELTERFYTYYMEQKDEDPDREVLLEQLRGWLSWYERRKEERQSIFPKPEELKISPDNLHFWTYFFGAAYPFSSDGRVWPKGDIHCLLHCYMEQVYRPSLAWRMAFTGYDQEEERIMRPCRLRFSLDGDFGQMEILFGLHHIEYKINDEPVYEQRISFQTLAGLEHSEEGILHFFLLLPLAIIKEDEKEKARTEIYTRLSYFPFCRVSRSYLTGCFLNNQEWKEPEEDRRKQVRRRCYSENAVYCFRSTLYLREVVVEVRAPGGWKIMDLSVCGIPEELKKEPYGQIPGWDGIVKSGSVERLYMVPDRQTRWELLQKVTDAFLPPRTVKTETFRAYGGRGQKAELVRRALTKSLCGHASGYKTTCRTKNRGLAYFLEEDLQGQWVYTTGNVLLHFDTEQNGRPPVIFYFTASEAWDPEVVVLSITGQQKKDCIRQEKRLMRRVCRGYSMTEWKAEETNEIRSLFNVCGYFMIEGERAFPIGVSDDGLFYTYGSHRLMMAEDFQRLLQSVLELDDLTAVSCCRGSRTTCRLTGKPELWYEYHRSYEDGNYPVGKFHQLVKEG